MSTLPVLIVGGGPVGLSAFIFLSAFGIRSLLVERHPGTSIVPKARGINARTMEIYRQHRCFHTIPWPRRGPTGQARGQAP